MQDFQTKRSKVQTEMKKTIDIQWRAQDSEHSRGKTFISVLMLLDNFSHPFQADNISPPPLLPSTSSQHDAHAVSQIAESVSSECR
jgi:hypothetical protein